MGLVQLLLILSLILSPVSPYVRRNGEPINIGFIFSLPYDISNTLRAPLAGPLSLALTAGLSLVMFFGILVSPVNYFLGLPPRSYHIRDAHKDKELDKNILSRAEGSRSLAQHKNGTKDEAYGYGPNPAFLDFMDSAFLLLPEEEDQCKLLMVCHSHGFLKYFPRPVIKVYQFISRKIVRIPEEQRKAITIGLEEQSECSKVFSKCSKDIVTIAKATLRHLVAEVMEVRDVHQL